jgi:acyl-CoA dehydrogenase
MTSESLLADAAEDLLSDICTHDAVQAAESAGWSEPLWQAVSQMGLPWIGVAEQAGGQGGNLTDALTVLTAVGRHALPLPLAECGLLGGWLLASVGLPVPAAAISLVADYRGDALRLRQSRLFGVVPRVPWARAAKLLVALVLDEDGQHFVAVLDPASLRIEPATNLAGEPRDTVHLRGETLTALVPAGPDVTIDGLRLRGALSRVAMIAGALDRVRDITVGYAEQRQQFGRSINRFQAVQQHLVLVAQQAAQMAMAAQIAGRQAERGHAEIEIASAKIVADEAIAVATRSAHQAHGAMGMTQEYSLQQFTRRLWSWGREYGGAGYWSPQLGRLVAERGPEQLYPLIAGGSQALAELP